MAGLAACCQESLPRQQPVCEPGVAGVAMQLLRDGVVIANTTSDANGRYSFAGVPPGTYSVWFTAPANTSFSTYPSGQTPLFSLSSGQVYLDADIGQYQGVPATRPTSPTFTATPASMTIDDGLPDRA